MGITPYFIIGFLAILGSATRLEKCGQPPGCWCTVPVLHSIVCWYNARVFPFFHDDMKTGVTEITLRHTQIVDMFPFDAHWMRLKYLDVRSNLLLSCDVISRLKKPGLLILSDCEDNWMTTEHVENMTVEFTTENNSELFNHSDYEVFPTTEYVQNMTMEFTTVPQNNPPPLSWVLPTITVVLWLVLVCCITYKRYCVLCKKDTVTIEVAKYDPVLHDVAQETYV